MQMIRGISKFIFNFLNFFDYVLLKVTNKSFLIWFKDFYEKNSYKKIELNKKQKLTFFTPNYLTSWLVDDFFVKEPETLEWIKNFNKENDKIIFWDVGANIGLYSIYAAKIHKNIKIVSFEPSTNNLRILSRNISINNLENDISIFQLPLTDNGLKFADFKESQFCEGASHNAFNYDLDFEGKEIKSINNYKIIGTSIKYILENNILEFPDYIKIDVDGIEHLILKGADKHLSNIKIKEVQIEVNENYKQHFETIMNLMYKNGFKLKSKKRNEDLNIYKDDKFIKTYNYYFSR